jgi:hypothetical protein
MRPAAELEENSGKPVPGTLDCRRLVQGPMAGQLAKWLGRQGHGRLDHGRPAAGRHEALPRPLPRSPGAQQEKRYARKVDAQRWLDEATSALVTQTWTAPERGRVTVGAWAEQWLAAQTGIKPSTRYR